MDEMNPAYENFLNNMSRLGRTPRETTRRVSASKFLGRDDLETRIKVNERKITLLKNIIQTQQMTTGIMLASLSGSTVGIDQNIIDIKKTLFSILETLKAQEKFEYEKFIDMQRRSENLRRRRRESRLEGISKRGMKILAGGVRKVLSPVTSLFSSLFGAFINLIGGKLVMQLADFILNPAVSNIIVGLVSFVERFLPLITGAFGGAIAGIAILLSRMGALGPILRLVARALGLGALTNLIGAPTLGPTTVARFGVTRRSGLFKRLGMLGNNKLRSRVFNPRIRLNKGGLVPGFGNSDTVPAMLTPGEIVISKPAVEKFGAINLLNLNKAAGSSNKPKIRSGISYANEGMKVEVPNIGDMLGAVMGSLQGIENSDLGKQLSDPSIPETLKLFAESVAIPKDQQVKMASGITNTVTNRISQNIGQSDFSQKIMSANNTPGTVPNLLPFKKLESAMGGIDIKSTFEGLLDKVNPQNINPQTNDIFNISLNRPNQSKLETLGLIP